MTLSFSGHWIAPFVLLVMLLPSTALRGEQEPRAADPAEIAKLQSADIKERAIAIMKLRRPEASAAIPALIKMLGSETEFPQDLFIFSNDMPITQSSDHNPTFGGEAAETLAKIGRPSDELLALLTDGNWRVRANAARALGGLKDKRAVESLTQLPSNPDEPWQVRGNAALALGLIGDPKAVRPLVAAVSDTNPSLRAAAANALARMKDPGTLELFIRMLDDPEADVRRAAVGGIGQIGGAAAVEPLMRAALHDEERIVREVATNWLGRTGDPRAVGALAAALNDSYINVRIAAARGLGQFRSAETVDSLIRMLSDSESASRQAAASALGEIGDPRAMNALVRMVIQENGRDWEIPVLRGLEALSRLGHKRAAEMLQRYKIRRPDWQEWWSQNKAQLLDNN